MTGSTYTVKQLEPFTCYKFRVWALIAETHACSPASPWYQTKPFGRRLNQQLINGLFTLCFKISCLKLFNVFPFQKVPSSPSIESIESASGESVEVRWSPPEKSGGPILGFNLNLTSNKHVISVATGGNVFFNTFYPTFHYI